MQVFRLTHNDLNEIVQKTVRSLMNESIKEVQGSIMADKEDVIQEIIDFIEQEWNRIIEEKVPPRNTAQCTLNIPDGPKKRLDYHTYLILIPHLIARKLGIAKQMDINVAVRNFMVPEHLIQYFDLAERGTEGTSYAEEEYGKYLKPEMIIKRGRIDLIVPAINDELQIEGLYSTIYHELNHNASTLQIKNKMAGRNNVGQEDLNSMNMFRASSRPDFYHGKVMGSLKPKVGFADFLDSLTYGNDKKYLSDINFVFYGLWEITERNARAESMYGDLKGWKATRETFGDVYQKTAVNRDINSFEKYLRDLEALSPESYIWDYAADIMNMKPRGRSINKWDDESRARFNEEVKRRFLRRSYELIEMLYKKAMKVATLYFQRQEEKNQKELDKPGGGLGKLNQLINTD